MANPPVPGSVTKGHAPQVITVTISPTFKLVFLSVLGITVLSMMIGCYLVTVGAESEAGEALMTTCITTFKLGFGVIIGLLGGKAM